MHQRRDSSRVVADNEVAAEGGKKGLLLARRSLMLLFDDGKSAQRMFSITYCLRLARLALEIYSATLCSKFYIYSNPFIMNRILRMPAHSEF